MVILAVSYLILPVFIFLFGYLKLVYALPFSLILLSGLIFFIRSNLKKQTHFIKLPKKYVFLIVVLSFVIAYFTGIGEFTINTSGDWAKHYFIIDNLMKHPWPVAYGVSFLLKDTMLTYYLGYYMIPALIGKLVGWSLMIKFMYMYTAIGLSIGLILVSSLLRHRFILSLSVFLILGGLDVLGWLLTHGQMIHWGTHVEGWTAASLQYSSFFTLLAWVPQHMLPALLTVPLIFEESVLRKKSDNLFFYTMLSIFWSTFVFIGFLPFVAFFSISQLLREKRVMNKIKSVLTIQNFAACIIICLMALYYKTNIYGGSNDNGFIWQKISSTKHWWHVVLFYILEVNILLPIMLYLIQKKVQYRLFIIFSIVTLNLIPFYKMGVANDFVMRSSIPALFFVNLCIATNIKEVIANIYIRRYLYVIAGVALLTQINEVSYRVTDPVVHNQRPTYSIKDLKAPIFGVQYFGSRSRFFYRVLAK